MIPLTHTHHLNREITPLRMVYKATNVGEKSGVGDYRFGFGGQEKTDELKGEGNHYTAEFWEYDPRLGRRWNMDPVTFFGISPYAAFFNNPIYFIDPSGASPETDPEFTGTANTSEIALDDGEVVSVYLPDCLIPTVTGERTYPNVGVIDNLKEPAQVYDLPVLIDQV